jgi:hypothetical protein
VKLVVRKVSAFAAFLVGLASLWGCSSGNPQITGAKVSGKVTYQGKVVTGGDIRVTSIDDPNQTMRARIDGDGQYIMPNAPTGTCKVVVDTLAAKSDMSVLAAKGGGDPNAYGKPVKYMPINGKYATEESTDYTVTVEKGEQILNIELK